ncbi:MAG: RloB domain-containing protein [Sarcina sp.]
MPRRKRSIEKNIVLYVEGETEKRYFEALKKEQKDLEISIKEINIVSGNYKSVIINLKKDLKTMGHLAVFVILDLDRYINDMEEKSFIELITYINSINKNSRVPYLLIGSNPDFEYFLAMHSLSFSGDYKKFLLSKEFKYKDMRDLKSDKNIFANFNNQNRSYNNAIKNKINDKEKLKEYKKTNRIIFNDFDIKIKGVDINIKISKVHLLKDNINKKGYNFDELFEVLSASK